MLLVWQSFSFTENGDTQISKVTSAHIVDNKVCVQQHNMCLHELWRNIWSHMQICNFISPLTTTVCRQRFFCFFWSSHTIWVYGHTHRVHTLAANTLRVHKQCIDKHGRWYSNFGQFSKINILDKSTVFWKVKIKIPFLFKEKALICGRRAQIQFLKETVLGTMFTV